MESYVAGLGFAVPLVRKTPLITGIAPLFLTIGIQ